MTKPRKSLRQMSIEASSNGGSLQCPRCGCRDLRVMRTEPSASGDSVLRTRYCRQCGRNGPKFFTTETVEGVAAKTDRTDTGIGSE